MNGTTGRAHVQHAQQAGERVGVTTVGRGGQEQEVADPVSGGQGLGQVPTVHAHPLLGPGLMGLGHLVGFVKEDHVPLLLQDLVLDGGLLGIVDGSDEAPVVLPWIGAGGQFALHLAAVSAGDDAGRDVEKVVQRLAPLLAEVGRDDDQQPGGHLAGQQLGDDEAGLDGLAQSHVVGQEHAHAGHLQGHDDGHELKVLGDGAAALQAEEWGGAVQQAEAVGPQQQVLGGRVADDAGRGWLQPARQEILEGDVELELFRLAGVDGRGDEDVFFLGIDAPQATPVLDDGAGGEGGRIGLGGALGQHGWPLRAILLAAGEATIAAVRASARSAGPCGC